MKIQIILWITIVFSAVFLPFVKVEETIPCCIQLSRELFKERSCQWFYVKKTWWIPTFKEFTTVTNSSTSEVFELCTTYHWDPDLLCKCPYGWDETSCFKPRFCTVSQQINDTVSESMSDDGRPDSDSNEETTSSRCIGAGKSNRLMSKKTWTNKTKKELRAVDRHVRKKWMDLPKCKPKCLGEINITNLSHIRFKNMTYYAIPSDSPCNKEAPPVSSTVYPPDNKEVSASDSVIVSGSLEKYQYYLIGAAIGIILFVMAVCILCVRKKKRETQNTNKNGIPMVPNQQNYMEENVIYNS